MDKIICVCEDSVDGIFTAIYKAWEIGTSKTLIEIRGIKTMTLFAEYIEVNTDTELASKVAASIHSKISEEVYYYVYRAALSDDSDKAQYIYEFLLKAFRMGKDIIHKLQDESVMKIFELARKVGNESHKYLGFVRFCELENGILSAKINPLANVVSIVAEHFADRLHNENWVILDTTRNIAAVHRAGYGFVLTNDISEQDLDQFSNKSENEEKYQLLWNRFFDTIAIDERKNKKLQQQLMQLRYIKYMYGSWFVSP